MKKNVFNRKLFKEQFRQQRLIGFIGLGLLSLITILVPVGRAMSISRERQEGIADALGRLNVNITGTHIYMYLIFTLLVPLLALTCFHYLTQRNSCDFYHALPHTRTCLFTCSIASIITWTTILVWVPTLISIIVHSILNQFFILDIALLLRFSLFIYVASLLVTAAISMACSLTGTVFTNVIVAGIIIFLPRIFMLVFAELVAGSSNILITSHLFPLIDFQYNVIFGLMVSIMGISFLTSGGLLFSFILTLIYFALGLLLFKRRKSEVAGQAAVSRKVQTVIRLILGTTVSLFPMSLIVEFLKGDGQFNGTSLPIFIYTVCILYLVACLVMLLYELLTTKKLRNVVKALPSIGHLVIINAIIVLAAFGLYKYMINYSPDEGSIDYIITEQQYDNDTTQYYDTLATSIKLDDAETLKIVSDTLKKNITDETNHNDDYYYDATHVVVGIHSGLFTHYRILYMKTSDYDKLINNYSKSQAYVDAYQSLPELKGNKLSLSNVSLSDEDYLKLYNMAREEIKSLEFDKWFSALHGGARTRLDTLYFYATVNHDSLQGSIPICEALPKTATEYLKMISSGNQESQNAILSKLKEALANNLPEHDSYYFDCELTSLSEDYDTVLCYTSDDLKNSNPSDASTSSVNTLVTGILEGSKPAESFDYKQDYILTVNLYYYDSQESNNYKYTYAFVLDHATGSKLMEVFSAGTDSETMEPVDNVAP